MREYASPNEKFDLRISGAIKRLCRQEVKRGRGLEEEDWTYCQHPKNMRRKGTHTGRKVHDRKRRRGAFSGRKVHDMEGCMRGGFGTVPSKDQGIKKGGNDKKGGGGGG